MRYRHTISGPALVAFIGLIAIWVLIIWLVIEVPRLAALMF